MVGTTISHYKILEKIGQGGMGEVYKAEDTRLGRNVAVKFLPEKFAQNRQALERFQREARAASALNHPNVCTIYDIGAHEGQPFIVMEFLEGRTLLNVIQDGPLQTDQLLDFGIQIAEALDAAHKKDIIHRDIKPANVFVTDDGGIKLLDFGLAKLAQVPSSAQVPTNLTAAGVAVGTPYYMAPEQLLDKEQDARSDIFSFGVLLYEMATGTLPFTGQDLKVVFNNILNSTPASLMHLNPELPAELERLIHKALEKDREIRYQSARDVTVDLKRLKRQTDSNRIGSTAKVETRDQPSIAVLPFENMSDDPEQEFFAEGMVEEIITALSCVRWLFVIARTSSFTYKGRAVDVTQVAKELRVRYVLEGSVRKADNRVRITAQLIDAVSGHNIWAEKFDRDLADIFELQDEISQRITATVEPELERAEQKRYVMKKPQNLKAWDYYQHGMSLLYEFTKEGNERAREMFEKAVALDPNYSRAFSGLAYSHHLDIWLGYTDSRENSAAKCLEAARTAVTFDDTDAFAHMVVGAAFSWACRHDLAIAAEERAVEINPSNAVAHVTLGHALNCAGRSEEGIPHIEKGLQLNPRSSRNHLYMALLARTHLSARSYEQAVEWARKAINRQSDYLDAHLVLAASLGHLGRRTEGRAALDECQHIQPDFVEKQVGLEVYQNRVDNEHILDGLRKAGLPE